MISYHSDDDVAMLLGFALLRCCPEAILIPQNEPSLTVDPRSLGVLGLEVQGFGLGMSRLEPRRDGGLLVGGLLSVLPQSESPSNPNSKNPTKLMTRTL